MIPLLLHLQLRLTPLNHLKWIAGKTGPVFEVVYKGFPILELKSTKISPKTTSKFHATRINRYFFEAPDLIPSTLIAPGSIVYGKIGAIAFASEFNIKIFFHKNCYQQFLEPCTHLSLGARYRGTDFGFSIPDLKVVLNEKLRPDLCAQAWVVWQGYDDTIRTASASFFAVPCSPESILATWKSVSRISSQKNSRLRRSSA